VTRKIRAIAYGIGVIGSMIARFILENKEGIE